MKKYLPKLFCILLVLVLALAVFSACKSEVGQGEGTEGTQEIPKIPYDLSEYKIIRAEFAAKEVVSAAVYLKGAIGELCQTDALGIGDDWVKGGILTEKETSAKEILVGNTNRPESSAALEGVDPTSFVVTVIGNKIVINSERSTMVMTAVEYFLEHYASAGENGTLMLPESFHYVSEPLQSITFISKNENDLDVIYLDGLDNTQKTDNENDRLDLDVVYAKEIRANFENVAKVKIGISTDWYNPKEDISKKHEILVGNTSRPETAQFLSTLSYNEYGFAVVGNKIVVCGWNETTTEKAVDNFLTYFKNNLVKHDDGTVSFTMLSEEKIVYDYDYWYDDFPEFENGTHGGTQDAGYGNLQVYYTDTTLDAYNAYCKKLEDNGFKLYMENTIVDNVHKCYTSKNGMVYTYYVPTEKSVRIVSCPLGMYNLPEHPTADSVPKYEKIAEPSITQMTLSYSAGNFGLCHIITLEDGSFIVYDGGGASNNDHVMLYNTLKSLNKRTDGKIVIAAWILTHEHWDHYTNFAALCKNYASQIVLEGLYCNTPSGSYAYNGYNPNYYITKDFDNVSLALGGVKKYIMHTGMKFYIRNACIEIIYSQEDLYPTKLYFFNDCTLISRVSLAGQTITYLGDVRYEGSDIMCSRYGNYLKSDIVQVSHHGYDGGTQEIYRLLDPDTCLWPTSMDNYKIMSSGDTSKGYLKVDNYIVNVLKVPVNIVAEPTSTIMLPFKVGDKIYYND